MSGQGLIHRAGRTVHSVRIRADMNHLAGPTKVDTGEEDVVVTCLVKNGAFYVDAFVDHYRRLGARHIFVLDNGSTDDTVERFAKYSMVTIFSSEMSVGKFQPLMKRVLARTSVKRGWCLDVDIDELFEFPRREGMRLSDLARYLNESGASAVVAQMLDMYSDGPISGLASDDDRALQPEKYPYFDLDQVTRESYAAASVVARYAQHNALLGEDPGIFWGGVRRRLFGLQCLLTKHPLFRVDRRVELFPHAHFCDGAKVADFSALLLHYKLVSNCFETSQQNEQSFPRTRQGYADLMALITESPDRRIFDPGMSQRYSCASQLLADGFIVASERFCDSMGT